MRSFAVIVLFGVAHAQSVADYKQQLADLLQQYDLLNEEMNQTAH